MTNMSYMSLERRELQQQQILHDQEKQLAWEADDLLHEFMATVHDDASVWDRFTQKTHELKEVLKQLDQSNERLQKYRDMQLLV